jgi:NitT/TauT family transport system substrate-binding protein
MSLMYTRRRLLTTLSLAGAANLLGVPRVLAGEGALETTAVRLMRFPGVCIAPQYVAEELLRAEGFGDIRYVDAPSSFEFAEKLGSGDADFSLTLPHA